MNEAMRPSALLRNAAVLVERALVGLDTTIAPCPHCKNTLFADTLEGRMYEQFTDLPDKLRKAAKRLDEGGGAPTHGYAAARRQYLERGPEGPTIESEALELLNDLVNVVDRGQDPESWYERAEQARKLLQVAGAQGQA